MVASRGERGLVLVADDEEFTRDLVRSGLRLAGYEVVTAVDGADTLRQVEARRPDLLILDVNMPAPDGLEVCRLLRARGVRTPVVFLTARDATDDKLAGFEEGADDYVTKPFSLEELGARVRAVLQRSVGDAPTTTRHVYADLELDEEAHRVWRDGRLVELSPTEFRLLRYLLLNAERVVSKAQILDAVWEFDFDGDGSVVEVYMSYLRKKIDVDGPKLLHTVRGVGYSLRLDDG